MRHYAILLPMSALIPMASLAGLDVSDFRCTAGPSTPPFEEQHVTYCIAVVRRGVFCYDGTIGRATLARGSLLLGNPGDSYQCSHDHSTGDECTSFECSSELLEEIVSAAGQLGWTGRFPVASVPCPLRVDALHALLWEALRAGSPMGIEEAAFGLIQSALKGTVGCAAAPRLDTPRDREHALAGLAIIEARATEELSLAEVAASTGLSPFHFLRVFRRVLGVTPHQALVNARLRQAVALLRDTAMPVTEVAYGVGFGDLSNFVRTFRRQVGWSPKAFRQVEVSDLAG